MLNEALLRQFSYRRTYSNDGMPCFAYKLDPERVNAVWIEGVFYRLAEVQIVLFSMYNGATKATRIRNANGPDEEVWRNGWPTSMNVRRGVCTWTTPEMEDFFQNPIHPEVLPVRGGRAIEDDP